MIDISELISSSLEGHLTAEQSEELKAWLCASPDNADEFARQSFLHSHARDLFAAARADREAEHSRGGAQPAPGVRWQRPAAAAAILVAVGVLVALCRSKPTGAAVATLLNPADVQWESGGAPSAGSGLGPGSLALQSGTARLRFAGGADVVVSGPARFELQSAGCIRLDEGRLTAVVRPQSVGFTVRTPSATITDQGTEFAVIVEPSGASETHVYRGTVKVLASGSGAERQLSANSAARVEADGKFVAMIPLRAQAAAPPPADGSLPKCFTLPKNWKGSRAGTAENNPVLVDGKPQWRFDRVWPDEPLIATHYVPLIWNASRWTGADHVQGGYPNITIAGETLELGACGPWGTGREGSTDPGGKWPALVFVAPHDGHYAIQGDARFVPVTPLEAAAHLLVLARDLQASSITVLKDLGLQRANDERPIEGGAVALKAGQELVALGQVRPFNNSGIIKIRNFRVVLLGE